ncbi:MAG: Na+/H+ antiporter subunit E [Alphaproteobacteria bacterium]|nr:MAG: Na+/H+ antiporter subunit E [Alphaproteobacteria bacterium]
MKSLLHKGRLYVCKILVIIYTVIIVAKTVIRAYLLMLKIIVQNKQSNLTIEKQIDNLNYTQIKLLSAWITLTPGTIAFSDKNKLVVHSIVGNPEHDINYMISFISHYFSNQTK